MRTLYYYINNIFFIIILLVFAEKLLYFCLRCRLLDLVQCISTAEGRTMQPKQANGMTINTDNREIVIWRTFNAPRDLVFRVYTDPASIPQWWGMRNMTTRVDMMDFKPGGKWRFTLQDAAGIEYTSQGEFREIVAPERIVQTFEFEGLPGKSILETVTFESQGESTLLVTQDIFETIRDLETTLNSGLEEGTTETFDRLEDILKSLKNKGEKP